jgi:uncharacterized protein YgiM (DUF1202 family)
MKAESLVILATLAASSLLAQTAATRPHTTPATSTLATPVVTMTPAPAETPAPAPAAGAAPAPAVVPAPVTSVAPTPAPAAAVKPASKPRPAQVFKHVQLNPGPAEVVHDFVNVRGQAALAGEIVCRLKKGDQVTVLEVVTLSKPQPDEPPQWARISLPTNAAAWISEQHVDASKTITARKLNLRAGPGENYSIIGRLEKGAVVTEISRKNGWVKIDGSTNAHAYVAAIYLKSVKPVEKPVAPVVPETPALAVAETKSVVPEVKSAQEIAALPGAAAPTPAPAAPLPTETVAPAAEPVPAPTEPAPAPVSANRPDLPDTDAQAKARAALYAATGTPQIPTEVYTVTPDSPQPETNEPKRVVQREGIVKPTTWNIQAPTPFSLVHPQTGEIMDYLFTTSTNLNLRRYKGLRILVSGEEGLTQRWKNTPVLTIQKIQVVE